MTNYLSIITNDFSITEIGPALDSGPHARTTHLTCTN